jgi:hypothetical protein
LIKGVNLVLGFHSVFRLRLLPSLSRAMSSAQWLEVPEMAYLRNVLARYTTLLLDIELLKVILLLSFR